VIIPDTERWAPGIGDPTPAGWFTVLAYVAVAGLCAWNAWQSRASRKDFIVWIGFTLLMAFLAVNKQLDLQSWFTQTGRDMAKSEGWYAQRQLVQTGFIILLVVLSVALLALLRYLLRNSWRRYGPVLAGLTLLLGFIVIRAATLHHVDRLLGIDFGPLRLNNVLELGSIALVALGAWHWQRSAH